jgi:hypothetical protein
MSVVAGDDAEDKLAVFERWLTEQGASYDCECVCVCVCVCLDRAMLSHPAHIRCGPLQSPRWLNRLLCDDDPHLLSSLCVCVDAAGLKLSVTKWGFGAVAKNDIEVGLIVGVV